LATRSPSTAGEELIFVLYDGSSSIGKVARVINPDLGRGNVRMPLTLRLRRVFPHAVCIGK
jgi:hypothetical protein